MLADLARLCRHPHEIRQPTRGELIPYGRHAVYYPAESITTEATWRIRCVGPCPQRATQDPGRICAVRTSSTAHGGEPSTHLSQTAANEQQPQRKQQLTE